MSKTQKPLKAVMQFCLYFCEHGPWYASVKDEVKDCNYMDVCPLYPHGMERILEEFTAYYGISKAGQDGTEGEV